ncbi:hypothetical protein LWI29_026244 [Acer saccharum]|uniref:Reverse transcriptase zinc-binding domain-containing protein n=1 Tax=Acer saccharum TaxID=4024 RepID=A0AA39T4V5_ACESA|nr:hypothetical protein LWI29_024979 [Acer saccharum]KAK0601669.1 hypothetical protein LWI29_026244 [Acer saccharum]
MSNFLWSGNIDVRKLVIISWDNVCLSKDAGGLGIRDPIKLNQEANIKFCWDSFTASSIWGNYFRNQFLSGRDSGGRSPLHIALKACISLVHINSRWLVGDGTNIHLWTDKWLQNPILSIIMWSGNNKGFNSRVSSLISDETWCIPANFVDRYPSVSTMIKDIRIHPSPAADQLIWEPSSTGKPSFADIYTLVQGSMTKTSLSRVIWNQFIPPRNTVLVWRLIHGRLPTDDNLRRKRRYFPFGLSTLF